MVVPSYRLIHQRFRYWHWYAVQQTCHGRNPRNPATIHNLIQWPTQSLLLQCSFFFPSQIQQRQSTSDTSSWFGNPKSGNTISAQTKQFTPTLGVEVAIADQTRGHCWWSYSMELLLKFSSTSLPTKPIQLLFYNTTNDDPMMCKIVATTCCSFVAIWVSCDAHGERIGIASYRRRRRRRRRRKCYTDIGTDTSHVVLYLSEKLQIVEVFVICKRETSQTTKRITKLQQNTRT